MHVRGDPDGVADPPIADEAQQICNFQLAPERRAVVAIRDRLERVGAVRHDKTDGHVGRDDLPRGRARGQRPFQPAQLCVAEERRQVVQRLLAIRAVRAAIAAHVEREHVDQRARGIDR